MADGSIRIETKLDNSKLKQQIKELEGKLNKVRKEQAQVDAQVDNAMAKYHEEREFDAQFPEEFSHREDIDKRAAAELDPLIAKQDELNQKEEHYLAMLDSAKAKLAEQSNILAASKQVDSEVKGDTAFAKVTSQAQYNSLLDATAAKMAAIEAAAARVAMQTGLTKEQILAANPAYKKLSDTMGMLKAKAADFGTSAKTAGDKASKAMNKAEKSVKSVGKETKRGISGFGKMQIVMMGIMMATRAISSATQEYIATNSELEGQINSLKSLWGQVLGPVIEWVINLIIQAIGWVNAFIYALTGINLVARANEAALKKQEKATKGAAKAAQLASFDEQTKLTDTSAGGGGDPVIPLEDGIGSLPDEFMEIIESLDWYGAGEYIAGEFMRVLEDIDWKEVGKKIANGLGGVITFILGFLLNLDPLKLTGFIVDLISGLMDGLSQVIQNTDWNEVGGDLVELLIKGMIAYLITTDPLAMLIALIFTPEGRDFTSSASELIGSICGALLAAIQGGVERIGEIGKELWNGIKSYFDGYVDWEGTPGEIISGLKNGIVAALGSIGEWIKENVWGPFKKGVKEAFGIESDSDTASSKETEKFGGNIVEGIKKGITFHFEKMRNTARDLLNIIRLVFVGSPAEKVEFGVKVGEGIINGLAKCKEKISQVCTVLWETIKEKFANVATWFKEKFSEAWGKVKEVFSERGEIFSGIKEGIESTFKLIVNKLIDGINAIIAKPFNRINSMLNTIRSVNVVGVKPFENLWSYNPLTVPQIPKLALGGIVNRPGRGVPAIIGEAGAEAVLPLENHTEWMDILADKIGGGTITIPISLDGKKIATYVVDIQKKKAFAMNGA